MNSCDSKNRESVLAKLRAAKEVLSGKPDKDKQDSPKRPKKKEQAAPVRPAPERINTNGKGGEKPKEENKGLALPKRSENMKRMFAYLTETCGIDVQVVKEIVSDGSLFEDEPYHNCVFVGFSGINKPAHIRLIGTCSDKPFRTVVSGSQNKYSWSYAPKDKDCTELRVFHDPIEAMSYMSLEKLKGEKWKNAHYLSLCNLSYTAIDLYTKKFTAIKNISVCLMNSTAGIAKAEEFISKLHNKGYECSNISPRSHDKVDAKNVVVTDERLKGITPFDENGQYKIGDLAVGKTEVIESSEKVTADVGTTIKNVAVVNGEDPDGNPLPPAEDEETYTVGSPITVEKTVSNENPKKGDTVTWTIKVTNTGSLDAHNVVVTDERLKGMGVFDENGKFKVDVLPAGESVEINVSEVVTIESGTIKNVVVVKATDPDGNPFPDATDEAEYTVAAPAATDNGLSGTGAQTGQDGLPMWALWAAIIAAIAAVVIFIIKRRKASDYRR